MGSSLRSDLGNLPAKKLAKATLRGEAPSKFLGRGEVRLLLERCFELAHVTKDQAAREMKYADASTVSKWLSEEVPMNFERLWSAELLRAGLLAALAESAGHRVKVRTLVEIERTA